jgi:DNA modification methylase
MTDKLRSITYLPPEEVKPNPQNPRKHGRAQLRALAKSIEAFGFNAPILVDRKKTILAGHGRLEAAKLLNLTVVPVICLNDLSEHEALAYMLADNKLSERSSWDEPLLAAHLKELSDLSVGFDLEATGFEVPEIDLRILSLEAETVDAADDFEVFNAPPVSRAGDVWKADEHVLCCGSSLEASVYEHFPALAKTVFTDPPYNVPIAGHVSGLGKIKHREFAQASGEMSQAAFTSFLRTVISLAKDRSTKDAIQYWCMDWRHTQELQSSASANGMTLINLCVWVKTNGGMGSLYRSRHELVFVFRNGSGQHQNNVQLGRFGRNRTNVWHYPGANIRTKDNALQHHPTPKPIALVADAIQDCTDRGDYVLDPFIGSGTTLLAAQRTGRKCLGIELDPAYVDTAIARWQKMTKREAQLSTGQSFSEVMAERRAS